MNYRDFDDNELIYYVNEKNEEAEYVMYKKYEPLIHKLANKMYAGSSLLGFEKADLIQEGMLGLNAAIKNFDENKDTSFYTFAKTIIERKMISLIIASKRQKHRILNESLSLENTDDEKADLSLFIGDLKDNPEKRLIDREEIEKLIEKAKTKLTDFEEQVFMLKINQFGYKEIAELLDRKPKAIDNALQRIKFKLKER